MNEDDEIRELRARIEELEVQKVRTNSQPDAGMNVGQPQEKSGNEFKILIFVFVGLLGLGIVGAAVSGKGGAPRSASGHVYDSPVQASIAESVAGQPYEAKPETPWTYRESKDPMTDKQTHFACVTSSNLVNLDWPYKNVSADLCLRQSPKYGLDVVVGLNGDGQIICRSYNDCTVKVRFGEGAQQSFSATDSADGSSNVIFIVNASRFVQSIKSAPTTKIQITLYQAGDQVLEFDTDKLEWPRS